MSRWTPQRRSSAPLSANGDELCGDEDRKSAQR